MCRGDVGTSGESPSSKKLLWINEADDTLQGNGGRRRRNEPRVLEHCSSPDATVLTAAFSERLHRCEVVSERGDRDELCRLIRLPLNTLTSTCGTISPDVSSLGYLIFGTAT